MSDDMTVKLSTPLKTHDGDLMTLKLRKPTARCFIAYGEPFKARVIEGADGKPSLDFDYNYKNFVRFLTDMIEGNPDDLLIGAMCTTDFYELRNKATHIIIGAAGTNPT